MPQYLTAAHSVCRKNYIVDKNGVAGAEPPYRSSAICATASCSGFVWLTTSILAWTRGGSPTLSPGKDAGRVCPKALHDAEPTSIHSPSPRGRGLGLGIENSHYLIKKTVFFYKLYVPQHSHCGTFFICILHKKNEKLLLIEKKCTIILTIAQKAHKKQRNIKEVFL